MWFGTGGAHYYPSCMQKRANPYHKNTDARKNPKQATDRTRNILFVETVSISTVS